MCGGISGTLGALSGIVEVAEERWGRPLSLWGLPSPLEVVRAPQSFGGACQVFTEMLPEIVRTTEGLGGGGPEVCGVSPLQPCGRPGPAPPQGRPQREAGRAKAAGRGGPQGWAAGLRGPRGGRRCSPAPTMARPRRLGCIPELQLAAFPAAAAAEDEAFLPESLARRAPRWPRSPPSSPVFFASPSPTFRRRLRLLRSFQDFGRQAWAG